MIIIDFDMMITPSRPQYSDLTSQRYSGYRHDNGLISFIDTKNKDMISTDMLSTDMIMQMLNDRMISKTNADILQQKVAEIKGRQFLVIGGDSYNMEEITKITVEDEKIILAFGAFNYTIYKQNIKNFRDIPNIIYDYFEHKHGKNIGNG
jgi:hypothetical protein